MKTPSEHRGRKHKFNRPLQMRCFLSCFGFSKSRKNRKPAYRVPSDDKIHGSYEPLDSDAKLNLNSNGSESEFSGSKGNETPSIRVKKKVSFNLNVKSYEPLPNAECMSYFLGSEEENYERNNEETPHTSNNTFPPNYRYQNWRDDDDDDGNDDMALEESDLDDYVSDGDDIEISEEHIFESEARVDYDESDEGNPKLPVASLDQELEKLGFGSKPKRDRSEYVFSVLNPIENLAQWKAVKAKTPLSFKQQRKENVGWDVDHEANTRQIKPPMEDIEVNTSLSNWLAPSK